MKTKIINCLGLFLFGIMPVFNQDLNKAKLDSFFMTIENHEKGMGHVSIHQAGAGIYQRAIGYAVVKDSVQNSAETKFRIGSASKTFTAVLILQLIEEEKLRLDTKLSEFYQHLPNADAITVEHLLRHRSGLFNFTNTPDYLQWMHEPKTRSEMIEIFVNNGTVFNPGEKTGYSNTNYVLLSYMAEKIEEKEYAEILQQRIVKPLNLKNTYYGGPIDPSKNEAYSYNKLEAWEKMPETNMHIPAGAGGIVSNSRELNAFYHALFTGDLLSEEALQQMLTTTGQMGMGIIKMPYREKRIFGHTGAIDGFFTQVIYIPQDSLSIAYCSNGVDMPVNDIMIGILEIFYGHDFDPN